MHFAAASFEYQFTTYVSAVWRTIKIFFNALKIRLYKSYKKQQIVISLIGELQYPHKNTLFIATLH